MSAAILIIERTSSHERHFYFGRDERTLTNIDRAESIAEITAEPRRVYDTGLDALQTVKRLRKILARLNDNPEVEYEVKTEYVEIEHNKAGPGAYKPFFMASGGKVKAKYGSGG